MRSEAITPEIPYCTPAGIRRWCELADHGDVARLRSILEIERAETPDLAGFVEQRLAPLQRAVGEQFDRGAISRAGLALAGAVVGQTIDRLVAQLPPATRRSVIVSCPSEEWHGLPALMVSAVLAEDGWAPTLLGPSVRDDLLAREIAKRDPIAVGISCTQPRRIPNLAAAVAAARRAGARVVVGGRALGATGRRAKALGADLWCASGTAFAARLRVWDGGPLHGAPDHTPQALLSAERRAEIVDAARRRFERGWRPRSASWLPARLTYGLELVVDTAEAALLADDDAILLGAVADWRERVAARGLAPDVLARILDALTESVEPSALRSLLLRAVPQAVEADAADAVSDRGPTPVASP